MVILTLGAFVQVGDKQKPSDPTKWSPGRSMASTTPLRQRVITQRAQPNSDMLAPPAAIIRSKLSSNPKKIISFVVTRHSPVKRTTPAST